MKYFLGKTLVCVAFWASGFAALAQPLQYTIRPVFSDAGAKLEVTVSFDGNAEGKSYLNYQDNQFGESGQMAFLEIPAQQPGVTVTALPDSSQLVVRHKPGTRVQVTYLVSDLQKDQPFYQYCCYKPVIKKHYFQVQSGHLLAPPAHYWDGPEDIKSVQLKWEGFPADWLLHNSFGIGTRQQVSLSNNQFGTAVFVGGDFRRHTFDVAGKPVHFVTRGQWTQFSDDSLTTLLQKTVAGHREFWQDFSDSIYSITFLPIDDAPWTEYSRSISYGGSGLTNSFMSFATNNPGMNYDNIRYIYVHELMHRWIGIKIENAREEQQYWFSEGFTEYFTLKNSLRYGLIDVNQFVNQLNSDFMAPHYSSKVKQMPNDSLNYERFWNGGKDWEKLPYRRGCLYAFYLDNFLRERSNGRFNLDAVMREILKEVQRNPGQKLDHAFFIKILKPFAGKKGQQDFSRLIEKGKLIDFGKTKLPNGLSLELLDLPKSNQLAPSGKQSPEIIKNIPQFKRNTQVSDSALKAALLR